MRLVLASRKSDLARLQAYQVGEALMAKNPGLDIVFHFRESLGDQQLDNPLWKMPQKGVFTEDFLKGLISGEFDMVVHSWKDLPTESRNETKIAATMPRADSRDLLLVRKSALSEQHRKWRVLTSSPRRSYFLQKAWNWLLPQNTPEPEFLSVRGNIPSRLRQLHEKKGEALVVAKAALDRLLTAKAEEFAPAQKLIREILNDCQFIVIPIFVDPPAPAQGALAIETRCDRPDLDALLSQIHCAQTAEAAHWERSQLRRFGGGCHLQIGAYQKIIKNHHLQILMGRPPNEQTDLVEIHFNENSGEALKKTAHPKLVCLRSQDLFDFQTLDVDLNKLTEALYVSHERAWPSDLCSTKSLVWTSGFSTWKSLTQKGIWVHGSSESLGEATPQIDNLLGRKANWTKLTHDLAPKTEISHLATYQLQRKSQIHPQVLQMLENGTHFYWHSGTLFDLALDLVPSLREKHHSSGPGLTADHLQKQQSNQSRVFLNEADWRRFYESSQS